MQHSLIQKNIKENKKKNMIFFYLRIEKKFIS